MSLFIHTENQTLLWNIISNMDITNAIFVQGSPQKSIWFKNIIEEFYIRHYGKNLTPTNLRELNREVIAYMVENLKSMYKRPTQVVHAPAAQTQPIYLQKEAQTKTPYREPQTEYSRNSGGGNADVYNDLFNKRQKDYESMSAKPLPPEVNFSENLKDEPISNMEELIKAQQKQREYDMSLLQPQNAGQTNHPILTIHKQDDMVIPVDGIIDGEPKKKVSWSDEHELKADILTIKQQIETLFDKLDSFRGDIIAEIKGLLTEKSPIEE